MGFVVVYVPVVMLFLILVVVHLRALFEELELWQPREHHRFHMPRLLSRKVAFSLASVICFGLAGFTRAVFVVFALGYLDIRSWALSPFCPDLILGAMMWTTLIWYTLLFNTLW